MKILIFAGTTEGRELSGRLSAQGHLVTASVATEYGKELLSPTENLRVLTGRMTGEEMAELMTRERFGTVVDATHPYAVEVTKNIRTACKSAKIPYYRLLRESAEGEGYRSVSTAQEAADYLNQTEGNILLTTGSKELAVFTRIASYEQRCYARVLPAAQVLEQCTSLGFPGCHIIAMQGPFTEELNCAMMKQLHIAYLVTKESGKAGGFPEKLNAAKKAGAQVVVIGRPAEEDGFTCEQLCTILEGENC